MYDLIGHRSPQETSRDLVKRLETILVIRRLQETIGDFRRLGKKLGDHMTYWEAVGYCLIHSERF